MKMIATKAPRHQGFFLIKPFVQLCVSVSWWLISWQAGMEWHWLPEAREESARESDTYHEDGFIIVKRLFHVDFFPNEKN